MLADQALDKFIGTCKKLKLKKVLDIGCGPYQTHARCIREAGIKVDTVDIKYPATFRLDYNQLALATVYDGIWCSHILEHQHNAQQFLRKVHSDLKEGGVLAITVPPVKSQIVGGHVSLWNSGLLLYNLVLAGFDTSNASVKQYGYNNSVVLVKKTIQIGQLCHCGEDFKQLRLFFPDLPSWTDKGFCGEISNWNWKYNG